MKNNPFCQADEKNLSSISRLIASPLLLLSPWFEREYQDNEVNDPSVALALVAALCLVS